MRICKVQSVTWYSDICYCHYLLSVLSVVLLHVLVLWLGSDYLRDGNKA